MSKKYEDGWYRVYGYKVYVENGKVIRGMTEDCQRTTYPYVDCKYGGYDLCTSLSLSAFRQRVKRDKAFMK